jgi:hypothetical protein
MLRMYGNPYFNSEASYVHDSHRFARF